MAILATQFTVIRVAKVLLVNCSIFCDNGFFLIVKITLILLFYSHRESKKQSEREV